MWLSSKVKVLHKEIDFSGYLSEYLTEFLIKTVIYSVLNQKKLDAVENKNVQMIALVLLYFGMLTR